MATDEIAASRKEAYFRNGYTLVTGVFSPSELDDLANHIFYMKKPPDSEFAKFGAEPYRLRGKSSLSEMTPEDLILCERIMRMHLFDTKCLNFLLDKRLFELVHPLWPGGALAGHLLYYPKPPGSRGFALHTDVLRLPVDPPDLAGCMVAVDDAGEENGSLSVVPGSHLIADFPRRTISAESYLFPEEFVLPEGMKPVLVPMKAGDVLLFHGNILHGSEMNRSPNRWRRSFVCHYFAASARATPKHFKPSFRENGELALGFGTTPQP